MSSSDVHFKSKNFTLAGNLYTPYSASSDAVLPAVIVAHPWVVVKEQTAGRYTSELFKHGFVTLAFDAAYQGETSGEPSHLEDSHQRAEDVKAAVTYLSTLKGIDLKRIGPLGICADGGCMPFAAHTDLRIKAVATVSAVDLGELLTRPFGGGPSEDDLARALEQAGQFRIAEAKGEAPATLNQHRPSFEAAKGVSRLVQRRSWMLSDGPRRAQELS